MSFRTRVCRSLCALTLLATGCATIPREAPELSAELGKRLNAIETAHLALLRAYFDERRAKVDDFVSREWVPIYAREVFAEPGIRQVWDQVVASADPNDRLQFIVRLGPRVQSRINDKSLELKTPLDEIERIVERRLRDDYAQAKAINHSVTTFLMSATDVAEARSRYMEMFAVTDQATGTLIDDVDKAVGALVRARSVGESAVDQSNQYITELQRLTSQLRTTSR